MPKNSLITKGTIYSKLYDNLRGVDFSSDHTRVADNRFAYLCNMYKDYKSAQGNGVETIPGYRELDDLIDGTINGIHERKKILNGQQKSDVYIHAGTNLYKWINFPEPQGKSVGRAYTLGAYTLDGMIRKFSISLPNCYSVESWSYINPSTGEEVLHIFSPTFPPTPLPDENRTWDENTEQYSFSFTLETTVELNESDVITINATEYPEMAIVRHDMANHKSVSFSFNNNLYILDGTNYIVCNGTEVRDVENDAYIPTIYINGIPSGPNATIGKEYEQRNMLSPYFKQTYVADGETTEYQVAVPNLDEITSIKVYGKEYLRDALKHSTTIIGCIRESFSDYTTGPINGSFKLTKVGSKWELWKWNGSNWLLGSHYEVISGVQVLTYDYTAEHLELENVDVTVEATPGFVKVNIDDWEASAFGGYNATFDFRYIDDDTWDLVAESYEGQDPPPLGEYDIREECGVQYADNLGWFTAETSDPKNKLSITRFGRSEILFDVSTVNDTVEITELETYVDGKPTIHLATFDTGTGIIKFNTAPTAPENTEQEAVLNDTSIRYYPEGYAGIEITVAKQATTVKGITVETEDVPNLIKGCTMVCMFDGRVFLSGNPKYPNNVFWCGRNLDTGLIDPSYWGLLNYVSEGVETVPVTAMLAVSDTLAVLKGNTSQDGSVFYHTAYETGENLIPVTYPSKQGLAGTGCLGASANFLDDPVFISKYGLEAIGQLSVRLERALEHRSTLVDAKLLNLDMSKAQLNVWEGYLILSIDGHVFMADSRQPYANGLGVKEYEWYYLEGIGSYSGQYDEYRYASRLQWQEHEKTTAEPKKISFCQNCGKPGSECTCGTTTYQIEIPLEAATEVYEPSLYQTVDLSGTVANPPGANGNSTVTVYETTVQTVTVYGTPGETRTVHYVIRVEELPQIDDEAIAYAEPHAYLVEATGAKIGGVYRPAQLFKAIGEHLLFGTNDGKIFCFNNDKRNEDGSIDADWYTFDGRTIECGCATKMDNCDIPHLTKTTVKKSIVIKTKKFDFSAAKIKVRTNRNVFNQVARINSMVLDFTKMDFEDFSFSAAEKDLFMIKEKERQWVEKQYYIYSDEYKKPFALYYLAYRYYVIGRYKNR